MRIEAERYTESVSLALTPESQAEAHQLGWLLQRLEKMGAGVHKTNDGQIFLQVKNLADCPHLVREQKLRELQKERT